MKIAIDLRLLSRGGNSGIEEYTRELTGALLPHMKAKGHEPIFFYNGFRRTPLPSNLGGSGAKIINWGIPNKLLDLGVRLGVAPKIKGADVIWSPHFNLIEAGNTPRVLTFHDLSFVHYPQFFSWKQRLWHRLQNWRHQAQAASHIIAVSEFTKSDLINIAKIPEEKISVIYSGINQDLLPLPKDDPKLLAWSASRNLHEKPFILYLGTLEPRKNIPALIRAFNILRSRPNFQNLELVLAGAPGWLYQEILREIAASPAKDAIRIFGPVGAGERVFLYNKCRAFIYPSFFEGFGLPPLEAQAAGVPVVAGNRTSLAETLDSSAILIDPWRVGDLAEAIAKCLEDENLRAKLIAAGLENAKRFSWKNAAEKTLNVLTNIHEKNVGYYP